MKCLSISIFGDIGEGVKFMICEIANLKTINFERHDHLKISSNILTNTFSDSLAILKFSCRRHFVHKRIPSSVSVPNSVETPHDSFPVPCPYILKGTHTSGEFHIGEEGQRGSSLSFENGASGIVCLFKLCVCLNRVFV